MNKCPLAKIAEASPYPALAVVREDENGEPDFYYPSAFNLDTRKADELTKVGDFEYDEKIFNSFQEKFTDLCIHDVKAKIFRGLFSELDFDAYSVNPVCNGMICGKLYKI